MVRLPSGTQICFLSFHLGGKLNVFDVYLLYIVVKLVVFVFVDCKVSREDQL